ncbi:MAG: hypothetical protein HYR90_01755 [Candidatus Andersenbacteria bacterium]|nr:hypothetical protein [Candidatus Andersenbacteria bacterium]MBI3250885.1 hypothetical protein [Candidatus Andersenbacteria bacterium]
MKKKLIHSKDWGVYLVASIAVVAVLVADGWSYNHNLIVGYGDSASHLVISRRVIDNLTPGLGQLGSSWLPALHVLMLPFIWNDFLWHTGLAGTIVSNLAYIGAAIYGYRLVRMFIDSKSWALAVVISLFANPNLLYMSTTAMNEALYVFSVLGSTVHLLKWSRKPKQYLHLLIAALLAFLTAFNRYEGWFLVIGQAVVVYAVGWKQLGKRYGFAGAIVFAYIAWLAPVLWLGWNLLIFSDPLEFLHNEYTSRAQQSELEALGQLPTKGNILVAAQYYYAAMTNVLGRISTISLLMLVVLSPLLVVLLRRRFQKEDSYSDLLIGYALLIPGIFLVYTLFSGVTALHLPDLVPFRMYNIRYALFVFPALVFFAAYGIHLAYKIWRPLAVVCTLIIILGMTLTWTIPALVLEEGKENARSRTQSILAAAALRSQYDGGKILLDSRAPLLEAAGVGAGNTIMWQSQLPLKSFIHEGTQEIWERALANPASEAHWMILRNSPGVIESNDTVAAKVLDSEQILSQYDLAYKDGALEIYRLKKSY